MKKARSHVVGGRRLQYQQGKKSVKVVLRLTACTPTPFQISTRWTKREHQKQQLWTTAVHACVAALLHIQRKRSGAMKKERGHYSLGTKYETFCADFFPCDVFFLCCSEGDALVLYTFAMGIMAVNKSRREEHGRVSTSSCLPCPHYMSTCAQIL